MNTLKTVWNTFYNWREVWLWPALAFANIFILCYVAYFFSGRWPQESLDVVVGIGINFWLVIMAITAVSILKESIDRWWPREKLEQLATTAPAFAVAILWSGAILKVGAFIAILWALKR